MVKASLSVVLLVSAALVVGGCAAAMAPKLENRIDRDADSGAGVAALLLSNMTLYTSRLRDDVAGVRNWFAFSVLVMESEPNRAYMGLHTDAGNSKFIECRHVEFLADQTLLKFELQDSHNRFRGVGFPAGQMIDVSLETVTMLATGENVRGRICNEEFRLNETQRQAMLELLTAAREGRFRHAPYP